MSAGTIALTNNSATVTGIGTAFTTDLKPNDFIVVIVGGVTYTLGVKATASATSLTLITPYGGPTATGNAWTAVPNATLVGITAQVAADVAKAIRGLNLDKANWQQVYSATGNITVTLPDGSTYTGPSWKYLSDNMATKVSGAVPLNQGGTGASTAAGAINNLGGFGTGAGNFAQGNDARFNTVNGKTGGAISGVLAVDGNTIQLRSTTSGTWPCNISFMAGNGINLAYSGIYSENTGDLTLATALAGSPRYFTHSRAGNFGASGTVTCSSVIQTSDQSKKDDIETITGALAKINSIRGCTYTLKDSGVPSAGVIAQELKEVLPEAIGSVFDDRDEYGEVEEDVEKEIEDEDGQKVKVTVKEKKFQLIRKRDDSKRSYTVEYSGVIALAVQAIKELSEKVAAMEAYIGPENLAAMSKEPTS